MLNKDDLIFLGAVTLLSGKVGASLLVNDAIKTSKQVYEKVFNNETEGEEDA